MLLMNHDMFFRLLNLKVAATRIKENKYCNFLFEKKQEIFPPDTLFQLSYPPRPHLENCLNGNPPQMCPELVPHLCACGPFASTLKDTGTFPVRPRTAGLKEAVQTGGAAPTELLIKFDQRSNDF